MKAAEIRSQFLKYFEEQGHTRVESSSLVPQNDPTLLFTNAGMNQFKDVFTGAEKRAYTRAVSAQKCVRAGGKHNDLENVGFTARHHTFFEMLGNFSFGDYFKKEAIAFAWKFTTEVLKLPKEHLYVTVYEDDDEAADIWHKQEGVPRERIYRFGEKDNFWSMGDTGPCGPCSEIFFDRGEKYGPDLTMENGGDRFVEFWNLVFMQYNRDASGKMTPLPRPSVDTGAGLERIAALLQKADSNYDTDVFQEIIQKTSKLAGVPYKLGDERAVSFRVIADHARAATFLIGDGVLPSNEGRGYVLRRIMRRAIRHGKKLGFTDPFFATVCGYVIDQMKDAYPSLKDQAPIIQKAVQIEEEQFLKTLDRGLTLLDEETRGMKKGAILSGEVAFRLYDTFGFPLDLTRVICEERQIGVDEAGFEKAMEVQRSTSRAHWKGSGDSSVDATFQAMAEDFKAKKVVQKFNGYDLLRHEGQLLALFGVSDSGLVKIPLSKGTEKTLFAVFDETPFYGESGGQVGDRGTVSGHGFEGRVIDAQKPVSDWVVLELSDFRGTLEVGKRYAQGVSEEQRQLTARNHTATHLLHWALREVLGKHVKQAGSLVSAELLRFDFSHFQGMTPEELREVENRINEKIWSGFGVSKKEMKKEEATAAGAIAFFGEKYGERVRVVSVGDFSVELCGGTHVDRSSDIHLFKIASESGIASGVRRIIAYTSKGAFEYLRARDEEIKAVRDRLKASSTEEIPEKLGKLFETEKALRKELEKLQSQAASGEVDTLIGSAKDLGDVRFVSKECGFNPQGVKYLREMADLIKQRLPNAVLVLGMGDPQGGKAYLLAAVGPQAPKTMHSGNIIKEISGLIDGRGGGKPDMAQAGGTQPAGIAGALKKAEEWVNTHLK